MHTNKIALFLSAALLLILLNLATAQTPYRPVAITAETIQELEPGTSLLDSDDNLRTVKRLNGDVWQFAYTRKQSGVIFKSYYFIVSKVIEPSGKTWTLVDEKKHLWKSGSGEDSESWTGYYTAHHNLYGDFRYHTVTKSINNDDIAMLIHPTGYVVYAGNNGAVKLISLPDGSNWTFAYDADDAKKSGDPHNHKPIFIKEPNGRTWTKSGDSWTSNDGQTFAGKYTFAEYIIGSGVHFGTLQKTTADDKLITDITPVNTEIVYDNEGNRTLETTRANGTSNGFGFESSKMFGKLIWCKEPNGHEYRKVNDKWVDSNGNSANATFSDESNAASHVGYGALDRTTSKCDYIWHATACDIETDGGDTVTCVHYKDGTTRRFWYKDGGVFKGKEIIKVQERDGRVWQSSNGSDWTSDQGDTFKGSFYVVSNLTTNVSGYGTFTKYDDANKLTEFTFSGCPAHVARRHCTDNNSPRGGGSQECHDDYYVVP